MNLGKLSRAALLEAARRAGISETELLRALRENPSLVARHGSVYSSGK